MRVGILTFHTVANPGAYLQAYATMKTLEEIGHEAVLIDYTNWRHRYSPWSFPLLHPRTFLTHPRTWMMIHQRERAFAKCQKYLNKTSRFVRRSAVSSDAFDAIVVGSDIVWNYEGRALGRDPIYFGIDLHAPRLIAFAPSCGNVNLSRPVPKYVRMGLPRFHAIAVRDDRTADLVERVIGRRPQLIADPTFGLTLEGLPEVHTFKEEYLMVYGISATVDTETQKAVSAFAREKRLKTVAVCYPHDWVDENCVSANPFEWLGRMQCARYVFTTALHGTAFALKLGKPFALRYSPQMESKIHPVIDALGRQDRVCSDARQLAHVLETPWDCPSTRKAMDAMADEARKYLEHALA